ncbi:MAG TPA: hypothetical protein VMY59_03655 [Candidatus Thermoplasmatota archaeon]|nr:hypothetical protein [Candidatus Thermoplasmatota archaeon]
MVNNPATNPISAKVMAVIFIALPPWEKKDARVREIAMSWSWYTSSTI